jgi:hypothetical protein
MSTMKNARHDVHDGQSKDFIKAVSPKVKKMGTSSSLRSAIDNL